MVHQRYLEDKVRELANGQGIESLLIIVLFGAFSL